ncbi:MAG: AIR synthase related protein [Pseudomonadota bacterium]
MSDAIDHVDYDTLDWAKNRFIQAAQSTTRFAESYGYIPQENFGASANVFTLALPPHLQGGLSLSLVPEGLGTADDARPDDLSSSELIEFWYNIGIKTVSVMTNDAASSGLQSIVIGLYLPSSTPEIVFTKEFMSGFLDGFVAGCKRVGCVYLSGETPQLKTKIVPGKLDIAGAVFAIVPPGQSRIGEVQALGAGDRIVLIESSGPHENGFTSLRDLATRLPNGYRTRISENGPEFWRAINAPSCLYTPVIQELLKAGVPLTNVENITGHGWQKVMRSKRDLRYRIREFPPITPVFEFVRNFLGLSYEKLFTVFNCGSGMAVFVPDDASASRVVNTCQAHGLRAVNAGIVEEAPRREVVIESLGVTLTGDGFALGK